MERPTVKNITAFLNRLLHVKKIKDASVNGLQVRLSRDREIRTVGFAVDACIPTFEQAKKLNADLLVVHHGIKWRPQRNTDLEDRRAAYLKKNSIALYAAHLPLDLHAEYGNNVHLAKLLDVHGLKRFGMYHGIKIGYAGIFKRTKTLDSLAAMLNKELKTKCRVLKFGKTNIRSIGIVSGGGGDVLYDAVRAGLDCFLTGEISLSVWNAAREYGLTVIAAGHYATETCGVRACMPLIEKAFKVKTVFISDLKKQ
ncbi:MAG: Nif3-like dinuclear metal center hexameric protein [Nitrospirota bacterium]